MTSNQEIQDTAQQVGILIAGGLKGLTESRGSQEFVDAINEYMTSSSMRDMAAAFAKGLGIKINDVSTHSGVILGVTDTQSVFKYKNSSTNADQRLLQGTILCTILAMYFPDDTSFGKDRLSTRPPIRPEEVHQRMSEMTETLQKSPSMFEWINEDEKELWMLVEERKRIVRTDAGQHKADTLMGQIEASFRLLEDNRLVQARQSENGKEFIPYPRFQQYMEDVGNVNSYLAIRKMLKDAEELRRSPQDEDLQTDYVALSEAAD